MTTPTVEAPAGIVTFVFTDIEGSTRLFHRLGDRYIDVLETHNDLLRQAWADHAGFEVSQEGDAFLVAFADAAAAARACAQAQRSLGTAAWPEDVPVRVRMGVHTGLASPRGSDYVALAVHQASRVVAAAHGGLVLLSQDTVDAVADFDGLGTVPAGRYRLRDFDEPLLLHRLTGAGLETSFPALRAVPADGHNLVRPSTPTLGRDDAVADVAAAVQPGRPLTLVGPGGVGKTRILTDVGIRIAPSWPDGVWFVDLASISDHELLAAAVAGAVGAPTTPGRERREDALDHLAERRAVVILDNAEHLADTARAFIGDMQASCPDVAVLAGSRVPLGVPGEVQWTIEPLIAPTEDAVSPQTVLEAPSGALFAERGAAVRPGFAVDASNAAAVGEICRRLDGLPLSLELAAAHLAVQSPSEILTGLDERFRLLRNRDPSAADRHRDIEGLLEWSYGTLVGDEQRAFRGLGVFSAGFSIDTATPAVASGAISEADVPMLVWSLVDRSLVVADLSANDTRYRLLETVRAYGRGLLDAAHETDSVACSLATAFLERVGPWQPADRRWLGEVAAELDNLRGLIGILAPSDVELAQQLATTIGRFHDADQSFGDGIEEVARYVDALEAPTPSRIPLLTTLADLCLRTGEVGIARDLVHDATALRDDLGVPDWDDVGVDRTMGEIARRSGDLEGAVTIARTTLERPLSDRGRSRMYNLLGTTSAALGDMETAYDACSSELVLNEKVGYEGYITSAHGNLAEVAMRLGNVGAAAEHQRACLDLAVAQGSTTMVAFSLIVAARIAGGRAEWDTAVRLQAQADLLLEEIGLVLYEDDRREIDELLDAARGPLGDEHFAAACREGATIGVPTSVVAARAIFAATPADTGV